jgi:hypothetical protein
LTKNIPPEKIVISIEKSPINQSGYNYTFNETEVEIKKRKLEEPKIKKKISKNKDQFDDDYTTNEENLTSGG